MVLDPAEEVVVEMEAPAADGTMKCRILSRAYYSSRFFGWWNGLQKASEEGAEAMLEGIGDEVGRAKKKD